MIARRRAVLARGRSAAVLRRCVLWRRAAFHLRRRRPISGRWRPTLRPTAIWWQRQRPVRRPVGLTVVAAMAREDEAARARRSVTPAAAAAIGTAAWSWPSGVDARPAVVGVAVARMHVVPRVWRWCPLRGRRSTTVFDGLMAVLLFMRP